MNNKKLELISLATAAYPGLSVNDAIFNYLRTKYSLDFSLGDLIAKYLYTTYQSVYNFDGVDDYGVLATRAINPDGDIDIEWTQIGYDGSSIGAQTIVAQCFSTTLTSREFLLRVEANESIALYLGGNSTFTPVGSYRDGTWRMRLVGTSFEVWRNGQLITSNSFTRGTIREPSAATSIAARNSGGSWADFNKGQLYNIRINGTLWQMADRNQVIQLPNPDGLGAELITPAVYVNPAVKGSQWTLLDGGRWQYVGDGTLNELRFIVSPSQPEAGYLEFEIESITGSIVCNTVGSTNAQFNSVGVKRYFYTQKQNATPDGNTVVFKRVAGVTTSCIIKNISFKPLGTCNPMQMVNTSSDRWQEIA